MNRKIPKHLQGILWSKDIKNLDLGKDKVYIVHQILMYGSLEDIQWLFTVYPLDEAKRVFLQSPLPVYTKPALNFIKKFILGLGDLKLNPESYVKALH